MFCTSVGSSEAKALEEIDLGQLSLYDRPQKAQEDVEALEDSESEHSNTVLQQLQECLADSDTAEVVASPAAPEQAPLHPTEPVVDFLSGVPPCDV